jgi:hypothetical protein
MMKEEESFLNYSCDLQDAPAQIGRSINGTYLSRRVRSLPLHRFISTLIVAFAASTGSAIYVAPRTTTLAAVAIVPGKP